MRTQDLPLVSPQDALIKGLAVIDAKGFEIALVVEGGRLVGIITDGDCRRAILRGYGLDAPVGGMMQTSYTAVDRHRRRPEVLDLMRTGSFEQIPVVGEHGELVGLHILDDLLGASPVPNEAVILCGGQGTRLRPITEKVPKPLIKVAGRPILERIILHLTGYGIRKVHLAIHYLGEQIEAHFGDGRAFGCEIDYLREEAPLGTGGCLGLLDAPPTCPLLVMNGDLITQFDVAAMLERHEKQANRATLGVFTYVHEVPFGVVHVEDDRVQTIKEKPAVHMLVNAGIYVLDPEVVALVPKGVPSTLPGIVETCLAKAMRVGVHFVDEEWMDIGRFDELQRARGVR